MKALRTIPVWVDLLKDAGAVSGADLELYESDEHDVSSGPSGQFYAGGQVVP